ncbi:hypothetical protein KEM52_004247 [Ascosphaera acerosa]|nr:hypothetical protein KEM52_004247 [Ascosphaera acerosa]
MATATAFLASHALPREQIAAGAAHFLLHVHALAAYMATSADLYDPDIAHGCIDLLEQVLRKTPDVFLELPTARPDGAAVVVALLDFVIGALRGPDPLPLRAASSFWTTLLGLPSVPPAFQPSSPGQTGRNTGAGGGGEGFFDRCLASLSDVLIYQISGHCARSDLDRLCEVLKKFVFRYQGAAKLHLGNALRAINDAGANTGARGQGSHLAMARSAGQGQAGNASRGRAGPSPAEQQRFLSVVIAGRGSRATLAEVKAYWIACRGEGFAYAR